MIEKDKQTIKVEKLGDRVEAVGRMFFLRPYVGLFGGNRVYLHHSGDIEGGGKHMQVVLPVFRTTFDLLYWAKHYLKYLSHHPDGREWTARLLLAREKELLDQLGNDLSLADASYIALIEREKTLWWIRNGKDKK